MLGNEEKINRSKDIIKRARKKLHLNQVDFGEYIGRSQGVVSGYESGDVIAPATVLIDCINILNERSTSEDMDQLIEKLKRFDKPEFANLRSSLGQLLDALMP